MQILWQHAPCSLYFNSTCPWTFLKIIFTLFICLQYFLMHHVGVYSPRGGRLYSQRKHWFPFRENPTGLSGFSICYLHNTVCLMNGFAFCLKLLLAFSYTQEVYIHITFISNIICQNKKNIPYNSTLQWCVNGHILIKIPWLGTTFITIATKIHLILYNLWVVKSFSKFSL